MANFSEIINSNQPVLVDFYADWCGPCKALAPVINELSTEVGDQAKILKVDIDKNQKASAVYQIRSVPTLILFKKGKILWRHSGGASKAQLKSIIQANL